MDKVPIFLCCRHVLKTWCLCGTEKIKNVKVWGGILQDLHDVMYMSINHGEIIDDFKERGCHNPNLGLTTKARGCKVTGQKGSPGVMPHALGSARECEGIGPHTPKGTPTLGVGLPVDSRWTSKCLESNCKGKNPMD